MSLLLMFVRCLDDCIMCFCFDMLPVFVLPFGASLKEDRSMHEPLRNVSALLLRIGVERVGVDEGKQLLLLVFP